jgi:superfamily II DNA/RNA helicase
MILDNENENPKVYEWISSYTEEGTMEIVTGYFTIGALAWLSQQVNDRISNFKLVLGDIVNVNIEEHRPLDLLNENITVEAALKLSKLSKEAVDFLKQDKVAAKTLEPNFCHAKCYIFNPASKDERFKYFITGSSNLTEAGIGLKATNNIELNIGETGKNNQYIELSKWFESLWKSNQAHTKKTIIKESGKKVKIDFKDYLIAEIEKIFIEYTPRELYYKVLFELFGNQILDTENDPEFNRQIGRLENSVIFNALYDFQQKGALSLIKILEKYDGAILADAVGLGKTWTALAVMKFFQMDGREIILLCPKKLQYNWHRYKKKQNSKFEKDKLNYFVRYHTDLNEDLINKDLYKTQLDDTMFISDIPKLFVIDESHNLRNDKSNRYKFFLNEILAKNEDAKVLMLSATPINNSLNDIRNQFKLIVKGKNDGFYEKLGIKNIDYSFRSAQKSFNEWRNEENPKISNFIKNLPGNFFKLTDALTVARTRAMIVEQQNSLYFPKKAKPKNYFVTPKEIGNFETFEELFNKFPPMLSGYQPSFYTEPMSAKRKRQNENNKDDKKVSVLEDEIQRDKFLVKMMYILMVKRLESSWFSLYSTAQKIHAHHQNALKKIKLYQENKKDDEIKLDLSINILNDEDFDNDISGLSLGKKRQIKLSEIEDAGNLNFYKRDLKKDIDALDNIIMNLTRFEQIIDKEIKTPSNHNSKDSKLEKLISIIKKKQNSNSNNNNQKLVIFTVYRDTAEYLFNQLKSRGFDKLAMVSGSDSITSDSDIKFKNFEPILERFAPYTKLFKEKEWNFKPTSENLSENKKYNEWAQWIANNDEKTYKLISNPIDILIATDALSEGQNLQDADMVVNYDIHWNPVRIIQRMGRIDRLGSPNKEIYGVNFWPSDNINSYLDLQGRIEQRMATMQLAGSEVDLDFSDTFKEMAEDENLENKMKARMLKIMEISIDDIDQEKPFGYDDLSLEKYRQDLLDEYNANNQKYLKMPKAVYTGFKAKNDVCSESGLIALLGYPAKPPKIENHSYSTYDLIYINREGKLVLLNQKDVLDALTLHKDEQRFVPADIDSGDETAIQNLVESVKKWLKSQAVEEEKQTDGTVTKKMGTEALDVLSKIKHGNKDALDRLNQNIKTKDKFDLNNFDLIVWFLLTK